MLFGSILSFMSFKNRYIYLHLSVYHLSFYLSIIYFMSLCVHLCEFMCTTYEPPAVVLGKWTQDLYKDSQWSYILGYLFNSMPAIFTAHIFDNILSVHTKSVYYIFSTNDDFFSFWNIAIVTDNSS